MSKIGGPIGPGVRPTQANESGAARARFDTVRSNLVQNPQGDVTPVDSSARAAPGRGMAEGISDIGRRLADARKKAGITQVELAAMMGSTQPSLARFEKDAAQPNVRTIERYASSIGHRIEARIAPVDGAGDGSDGQVMDVGNVVSALCEHRKQCGLTQAQVAGRMKTTQPIIARLEKSDASPNLKTLQRYAEAIGMALTLRVQARG